MTFYTLAVSGADRVRGVHEEFAGRTTGHVLDVLTLVGIGTAVLFAVLIVANYVQQRRQKTQEAQHRAELEARLHRAERSQLRY